MPRLLLVDDNPSIHKIAESLLAHTQIELVCAESGPKALGLIESASSPFDVALIDISMADMDGWELLGKLRAAPATARMPIAMMAGVLDTVDPGRLADAPIQGFLKKPVELRDLPERIQTILDTPVPEAEATPEAEPEAAPEAAPQPEFVSPFETLPAQNLSELQARLDTDDILELTEEDLYPEEPPQPAPVPAAEPLEEDLDLEELDFDSLKDLNLPEPQAEAQVQGETAPPEFSFDSEVITIDDLPALVEDEDTKITQETPVVDLLPASEQAPLELPEAALEEVLESPFSEPVEEFTAEVLETAPAAPSEEPTAPLLDEVPAAALAVTPVVPAPELPAVPVAALAATPEPPAVTPAPAPEVSAPAAQAPSQPLENPDAQALAAAIMADPALLSALAKAVATHLSEQTLREVAWEVMPEIAERQKYL